MFWKLIKNDIKNNKLQTFNITFFIVLSVAFLATAGQLGVQLTSSIHQLFQDAKTPHFLQMHTGELDKARMEKFVAANPEITDFQVLDFLNIDNTDLAFNGKLLKDSVYDNGFSTQSPRFDYLLDMKGELIDAQKGEVYVPIFYQTAGLARIGDSLTIRDHKLRVAGFVRDSQMNSSISVSRRFIIHEADYDVIEGMGDVEYLIEFRLKDPGKAGDIEAAYSKAHLEADGPPVMTYTLFMVVNAFSDGITIVVLLFISILVIGISLLCIRLTLLAKLEEDYKELAVLKAIGIPLKDIQKLFLSKYIFIAGIASLTGFALSFLFKQPLLSNMKLFFGEAQESRWTIFTAFALSALVFLVLYWYMKRLTKQLKSLSLNPAQIQPATRSHKTFAKLPQTLYLTISDLLGRKKVYGTMLMVFILSIFILTVPMSIYSTISNHQFVRYLGAGDYDVRVDLAQVAGKEAAVAELVAQLKQDERVDTIELYRSKMVDYQPEKGSKQRLWLEFGNQTTFPIAYMEGKAPQGEQEISLSKLKADDLKKTVGDKLRLTIDGEERVVTVSGIYSDLTNGGKTAKANFKTSDTNLVWMILPIELKDSKDVKGFIADYQSRFAFAKLTDTQNYVKQIFGNTIQMVGIITWLAFGASLFLVFLIGILFIRMIYLKDQGEIALLKALGFTNAFIQGQYLMRAGLVLLVGLLLGNLLAITVGDGLAGGILSMIGVSGIDFVRDPLFTYLLVPIAMLFTTFIATYLGLNELKTMDVSQLLKEE